MAGFECECKNIDVIFVFSIIMQTRQRLVPCQAPPPLPSRFDNYDKIDTQSPLRRDRGELIRDSSLPSQCTHIVLVHGVLPITPIYLTICCYNVINSDKNTLNPPASHTLNCQNVHLVKPKNCSEHFDTNVRRNSRCYVQ